MSSRLCRLPRLMASWALLRILVILPTSALAQGGSSAASNTSAAQSAAIPQAGDAKPGSDILNMDIEQLARTPVVVPSMDIPVTSVSKEAGTWNWPSWVRICCKIITKSSKAPCRRPNYQRRFRAAFTGR